MARTKISKAAKDFNVSISTVVEFLQKKGITIDDNPNTRIDEDAYDLLVKEYKPDRDLKSRSDEEARSRQKVRETVKPAEPEEIKIETTVHPGLKVLVKIDLDAPKAEAAPEPEAPKAEPKVEAPKPEPKPEAPKAAPKAETPKAEPTDAAPNAAASA